MKAINNIIADIRDLAANRDWHNHTNQSNRERLLDIADRIEQAVTNCNQLKMREALEWFWSKRSMLDFCHTNLSAKTWEDWDKVYYFLREFADKVQAALSVPPRNCDLYKSESEAYQAYLTAMKNATKKTYVYFEPWLFAEAKGEMK